LGPQAKFVEEKFYPPFQARLGAAYTAEKKRMRGKVTLSGDFLFSNDMDEKLLIGMEYLYKNSLAVRFGYRGGYYAQGVTMGIGVVYDRLRFDYAYMPIEFGLGDSHRFSINVFSSSL
jgi:hypothetical protein